MIEERLKTAMQKNLPDPPEGFSERVDGKLIGLSSDPKHRPRFSAKLAVVFVLVLSLGIVTALAAANETVNAWLYDFWPEAATTLMPAHTSCERDGIRLALSSASVRDNVLTVEFTLEDLEGDRISEITEAEIRMIDEYVERRFDPERKQLVCTWTRELQEGELEKMEDLELEIGWLQDHTHLEVDLFPLLAQYGSSARYTAAPEDMKALAGYAMHGREVEVLDWNNSAEVQLSEHVRLSGIGIRDGVLHVQFHYPEHNMITMRVFRDHTGDPRYDESYEGADRIYTYPPYTCWVLLDSREANRQLLREAGWGYGSEELPIPQTDMTANMPEWDEFFFTAENGLEDATSLIAEIHDYSLPIAGGWDIRIPTRLIKNN